MSWLLYNNNIFKFEKYLYARNKWKIKKTLLGYLSIMSSVYTTNKLLHLFSDYINEQCFKYIETTLQAYDNFKNSTHKFIYQAKGGFKKTFIHIFGIF